MAKEKCSPATYEACDGVLTELAGDAPSAITERVNDAADDKMPVGSLQPIAHQCLQLQKFRMKRSRESNNTR